MKKNFLIRRIDKTLLSPLLMLNYSQLLLSKGFFLGILLLLTSCTTDNLQKPLDEFQKDTKLAATATAGYYNELNSFEQDLYLKELASNPDSKEKIIEFNLITGAPKPIGLFKTPFSPKAIQARIVLIQGLSAYADGLSKLAGNTSDKQFKTNIGKLSTSLTDLQSTFSKLTASEDSNASKYVGPLSTIVGIIGGQVLKEKRDKALKAAIVAGEGPINALLDLLAEDLKTYVEPLRDTGNQEIISGLVNSYLKAPNSLSVEQRKSQLTEIKKTAVAYQSALDSSPSAVILKLKKVHMALVEAAKTPTPINIGKLLAAVAEYESQIQELVEAVKKIQELNK